MTISVRCNSCGIWLTAPAEAAGRRVHCPKCGTLAKLPTAPGTPPTIDSTSKTGFEFQARPSRHERALPSDTGKRREVDTGGSTYISRNLMAGEHLVCVTRIHPLVIVPHAILSGYGLLAGSIGFLIGDGAAVIGAGGMLIFGLGSLAVLALLIERMTTEYACTDRRICIRSGVLTKKLREMPLSKVEALLLEQSLFGRLFGYGTLVFNGSGGTRRMCKNIEGPVDFHRQVQEQVALAQGAK